MFTIISIMFVGIGIGYVLRNLQFLQKIEKSTSLTIFLLLFVLGISIGSNSLIINNLAIFIILLLYWLLVAEDMKPWLSAMVPSVAQQFFA